MSTVGRDPAEVDAAVDQFVKPTEALDPLPPIGRAAGLYANPKVHRAIPAPVAFGLAKARTQLLYRRNEDARKAAEKAMRYLLGKSERAGDVKALTLPHMIETANRSEFMWRPWMADAIEVKGDGPVRDLLAGGTGVITNFMHHGPFVGLTIPMNKAGFHQYAPIAPFYFETPTPGYHGHRDRQHMLMLRAGATVFTAAGSFGLLKELLDIGRIAGISFDVPGRTEMTFLGRRVLAASGAAKAAMTTGAHVVPMTMQRRRRGGRQVDIVLLDPIDPSGFDSVEALQQAMANAFEPVILEWPEAVEWPLERWMPADPADAEEFGLPAPPEPKPADPKPAA